MKIKKCPKCGTLNDGAFQACKKCYTSIGRVEVLDISKEELSRMEDQIKIKICPKCGTINDGAVLETNQRCRECYTPIDRVEVSVISREELPKIEKKIADEKKRAEWETINAQEAELRKQLDAEDGLRKKQFSERKRKLEESGNIGFYEYKVISVADTSNGGINLGEIQKTLTKLGRDGWRLVSSFTNEVGKNALGVGGFGVNGTLEDTILIFERFVPFD